jgi:hypothetical protein
VISNAGKILHTTPTKQNNGVLLEIVAFSRDVTGYFETIG